MATYAVQMPSATSTTGRMVKVAATSSPGTTLHVVHATAVDEIFIDATNTSSSAVELTIELGGTNVDDRILQTIQPKAGLVVVVDGKRLTGGVTIGAYAGTTNVINCKVDINRIT